MKIYIFFVILISFIIYIIPLNGCSKKITEEDKIRMIIEEVGKNAEEKETRKISNYISQNYHDSQGNDHQAIRGLLVYHFLRAENISVFIRSLKIEVEQDTAAVKAKVILARGKKVEHIEDLLPESAGLFVFEVTFNKEKNKWMVIEANWRQTGWEDIFSPE